MSTSDIVKAKAAELYPDRSQPLSKKTFHFIVGECAKALGKGADFRAIAEMVAAETGYVLEVKEKVMVDYIMKQFISRG